MNELAELSIRWKAAATALVLLMEADACAVVIEEQLQRVRAIRCKIEEIGQVDS
jgi:hypothetical protein